MALLKDYEVAKCCYEVFGSYTQNILMDGELGAAYVALALGVQFVTMNKQELADFKERVERERKLWLGVNLVAALGRKQPIGYSWRSVWDEG